MKKVISYLIPCILCALVITLIYSRYFLYEYKMNIAYGIGAPIGVSICYLCFFCVGMICVNKGKYTAAIVLSVIKYVLLFIGITFVFRHTLTGLTFAAILLFIPITLPIAIAMFAIRIMIVAVLAVFYIGIISEPIIIAFCSKTMNKPLNNNA